MRKQGNIIIWDIAHREGDHLVIGGDLQNHLVNLFGLGEKERKQFARKEKRRTGKQNLWLEQLSLLDNFGFMVLLHAKEIRIKLDGEGWSQLVKVIESLDRLNRKMNR